MQLVLQPGVGPLLNNGTLGFFLEVLYFVWVAELLFFAGARARRLGRPHAMRRKLLALIPGAVGVAFLVFHVLSGERLNWAIIAILVPLPIPFFYLIARLVDSMRIRRGPGGGQPASEI